MWVDFRSAQFLVEVIRRLAALEVLKVVGCGVQGFLRHADPVQVGLPQPVGAEHLGCLCFPFLA
jgi:hypothetical protein